MHSAPPLAGTSLGEGPRWGKARMPWCAQRCGGPVPTHCIPGRHKGKFELTYVSKAAVIVKTLATGARIVLKSGTACADRRLGDAGRVYCVAPLCLIGLSGRTMRWHSFVSPSHAIRLAHEVYGYEVSKVTVYQGRYIVGRTHTTLLLVCARGRTLRPLVACAAS